MKRYICMNLNCVFCTEINVLRNIFQTLTQQHTRCSIHKKSKIQTLRCFKIEFSLLSSRFWNMPNILNNQTKYSLKKDIELLNIITLNHDRVILYDKHGGLKNT